MHRTFSDDTEVALERWLCSYFERKYCVLTGRAATAIYLALCAISPKRGKVVLPAVLCPSPANAVLYAGLEPVFCDVTLDDYTMDLASLSYLLETNPDIVGVVPVHLYGHPANLEGILSMARQRDLFVLEDAAQAMGVEYSGRRVGSFGDVSVVSFGHTKIVDAAYGGCALTDDPALAHELRRLAAQLPERPSNIERCSLEYRESYYRLKALVELDPSANALFLERPAQFRDIYLYRLGRAQAGKILESVEGIEDNIASRRRSADMLFNRLRHCNVDLPSPGTGSVPWRFSFMAREQLQRPITNALRREGFDASNWYPSLHRWYEAGRRQGDLLLKNSIAVENAIVNIWVHPPRDDSYIRNLTGLIERTIERGA